MLAAIAQHLKIDSSRIKRIEEWSNCLFAVVVGLGGRFVSKKVVKTGMVEIICKRSGLRFQAESKRTKQHPQISNWLQQANSEGWYASCVSAIEKGSASKLQTIEEFEPMVQNARTKGLKISQETADAYKQREEQIKFNKKKEGYISKILRENGYDWHSFDVLDIAQGETGEKKSVLFKGNEEVTVRDALAEIAANNPAIERGLKNFGVDFQTKTTKIYLEESGNLTTIATATLATARSLIGRSAQAFLKSNFTPGTVVEVEEGQVMLDKMFNAMKPGYHLENPARAKELAGVK